MAFRGVLRAPGDKSISQRALILGGMATGETRISGLLESEDVLNTARAVRALGATVTRDGEETEISTKGRHDPCVGVRAAPIAEAMVACVLADAFLRHRGQVG